MLKGEKLSFSWGKGWLFKNISFSFFPGESFFIQGANGCGKTTFLKMCATLLLPSQGQLYFQQKNLSLYDITFKKNCIFIGHTPGVKEESTVGEFLDLFQIDFSSFLYFGEGIKKKNLIKELSYGQQKRLALSRWVHSLKRKKELTIWIGDECFSGLDLKGQELLLALIQQHLIQGGIFLASHHGNLPLKPTYHFVWEKKEEEKGVP